MSSLSLKALAQGMEGRSRLPVYFTYLKNGVICSILHIYEIGLQTAVTVPHKPAICCKLDIWQEKLTLGDRLPTLPLWLHGEICLPVELDSIYERTCREQRITIQTA